MTDTASLLKARLRRLAVPFADVGTRELPMTQILRLSLFQVTVGMLYVMFTGTLNRVMIYELGIAASLLGAVIALPILFAPLRLLIGHRSDHRRSALGWRRVPYLWIGTLLMFGGLAVMPFGLLVQAEYGADAPFLASLGAALAFFLAGLGVHVTQTTGLALTNDLAPEGKLPQVVGVMYVMLLLGMVISTGVFYLLLSDFSHERLVQVLQGAALVVWALNVFALWRQEPRDPERSRVDRPRPPLSESWQSFVERGPVVRLLVVIGIGAAGFGMQDIIIEPYGASVLGLEVAGTTLLTGLWAIGMLIGFWFAKMALERGINAYGVATIGALVGVLAFSLVIVSAPLDSPTVFRIGQVVIGVGGALFYVGTLAATMSMATREQSGIAIGAWGAVQATVLGAALAAGAGISDLVPALAEAGRMPELYLHPAAGYSVVYSVEIVLLLAMVVAAWPLARFAREGGRSVSPSTATSNESGY
ncbi:MAG: BCD family MFS transporter [Halorhodospira halophila]|uniref:BCD family MFS transporter n=1 Tax=Halorhodospira TaxID=85108 RepID=UPI0019131B50|nr:MULTISPECIES: BCD family MFS transporter [Halorhodospira]MBK5936448.1 MFS transporter [Halorhodospira halophila]MCC3750974.1 BCD family MFS transporter [Halorhodospira halophila]MCG5527941.1 BCD family MFS transporter [Halorhodospira halophila]MCG5533269.1 BCD family MFS transporter [Halorhodospira sp. 9621]MCG5536891.1 BCD family MFS transporter [Halorhodospira sp. 9622]